MTTIMMLSAAAEIVERRQKGSIMKWTTEQLAELKAMAIAGTSNADLAAHFGVPVTEIYAVRSRHQLTIDRLARAMDIKGSIDVKIDGEKLTQAVQEQQEARSKASEAAEKRELSRLWLKKAVLVESLGKFLREDACANVALCRLEADEETVTVFYLNGYTKAVNVAGDSNLAIMLDVCNACM